MSGQGNGWAFVALGQPAPQGSKSFKGMVNGHAKLAESSKAVKPWREAVKAAAPSGPTLDGPVAVYMVFTLRRPAGARKRETIPYRTPDLSKLARSTEDALKDAGLLVDDARISEYLRLAKVWTDYDEDALRTPGLLVAALEMDLGWPTDLRDLAAEALSKHQMSWQ